jgi:hypothetical protein
MKRSLLCAIGAVAVLAACSTGSDLTLATSLQLTPTDTAQAAAISAGDATAEDADLLAASELSMDGGTAVYNLTPLSSSSLYNLTPSSPSYGVGASGDSVRFAFWSFAHSCTFTASSGRFVCPDEVHNGLTLSRSAAFYDASGAPMSRYNDTTTASANFQMAVNGVHVVTEGADSISRTRSMTATTLLGHETSRTWNGTGSRTDGGYRNEATVTRTYHTADAATFANIVVSLPRSAHPWPMSGTVTRNVNGMATVVKSGVTKSFGVTKTVTITFNGTRLVPMTVGSMSFTLDLFTGKVVKT